MGQWFYEEKGIRPDAVDEQQMIALIKAGRLGYGSNVWQQGMNGWTALEHTSLRQYLRDLPPPLSGRHVNNTLVWILAFAPLIGFFFEGLLAVWINDGNEYQTEQDMLGGRFWYVTLGLNILLSVFDERKLKQAGQDTRHYRGWVWLVPVYLYQRARAMDQNLAYFITWLVCFALILLASAGV